MNDQRKLAHAVVKSLFGTDDYMGEHEEKTISQRLKEQLGPRDRQVAERMRWEGLENLAKSLENYIDSKCPGTDQVKHAMRKISQEIRALAKAQRQRARLRRTNSTTTRLPHA